MVYDDANAKRARLEIAEHRITHSVTEAISKNSTISSNNPEFKPFDYHLWGAMHEVIYNLNTMKPPQMTYR